MGDDNKGNADDRDNEVKEEAIDNEEGEGGQVDSDDLNYKEKRKKNNFKILGE